MIGLITRCAYNALAWVDEYDTMIMPADEPGRIGLTGIGSGPFRIVSVDPARGMVPERHPGYSRTGFPYLDRLAVRGQAHPPGAGA